MCTGVFLSCLRNFICTCVLPLFSRQIFLRACLCPLSLFARYACVSVSALFLCKACACVRACVCACAGARYVSSVFKQHCFPSRQTRRDPLAKERELALFILITWNAALMTHMVCDDQSTSGGGTCSFNHIFDHCRSKTFTTSK